MSSGSGPLASSVVTRSPRDRSAGRVAANNFSAHCMRHFSRALLLTHLLIRCVMRGAQPTTTQWVAPILADRLPCMGASCCSA